MIAETEIIIIIYIAIAIIAFGLSLRLIENDESGISTFAAILWPITALILIGYKIGGWFK